MSAAIWALQIQGPPAAEPPCNPLEQSPASVARAAAFYSGHPARLEEGALTACHQAFPSLVPWDLWLGPCCRLAVFFLFKHDGR